MKDKSLSKIEKKLALYSIKAGDEIQITGRSNFKVVSKRRGRLVIEPITCPVCVTTFDFEHDKVYVTRIEDGKLQTKESFN